MPIKCPVAPLEFAFLADWYLRERGIRDRVELVYATPLDGAFTKPVASKSLRDCWRRRRSSSSPSSTPAKSTASAARSTRTTGATLDFDLLVTVPVHGGAAYVERSPGLGDALGFVPTDKHTLQTPARRRTSSRSATRPTCRSRRPGSVTHFEAEVLAENVARYFAGRSSRPATTGMRTASSRPASARRS